MLAKKLEYEELYVESEVGVEKPKEKIKNRPILNTHLRSRCMFLFVVLTAMAMFVTVRSGMIASEGYELVQLQKQAYQLEQENEHMKIEIAHLKAPQRIQNIATQQLGMVVPQQVYFANGKE